MFIYIYHIYLKIGQKSSNRNINDIIVIFSCTKWFFFQHLFCIYYIAVFFQESVDNFHFLLPIKFHILFFIF